MKTLLLPLVVSAAIFGQSHDITSLSSWGPYSKHYAGISKVSDLSSGLRVDFSLMPGMYRRNLCVPDLLYESGCHPWYVSPDMSVIRYRQEIEWKDRVYVDATYHTLDESTVLLEMHCVNNTDIPQDISLHTMATLACEENHPEYSTRSAYIAGNRYENYEPRTHRHDYALVYDGWFRGEVRDKETLSGFALRTAGETGDRVTYDLASYQGPVALRYRTEQPVKMLVNGQEYLFDSSSYAIQPIGEHYGKVEICAAGPGCLYIDALLLGPDPKVEKTPLNLFPEVEEGKGRYILKFDSDSLYYGVGWNFEDSDVIQYLSSDPDLFIRTKVHNHVDKVIKGDLKGQFTSAFQRPVCLAPGRDTTLFNLIVCGSKEFVHSQLDAFRENEASYSAKASQAADKQEKLLPGADRYAFARQLMQATILTNVVYPVYTQGSYIRHFAPGKNWNSLYTWDSGFIAWGMADIDPVKAFEIIRAYTTEEGSQSAFIHHGTPLPIQILAFSQLLGETGDEEQLAFLYPRLKRFYNFACGHDSHSTMMMESGLVRTWDYFYNSGGWDDYPPQQDLRQHPERYASVAPVVSTSYYIRAAKILRQCAQRLSLKADVKMFDADIEKMSNAIQDNAWDAESGYFGYVTHDASGKPDGLYRYPDGENFNMGLDGVSPLVAGICTDKQEDILVGSLFDPGKLWTKVGISTVDQSAPYYSHAGYWNGCVWMPHQLILWKTMLDLGRPELAEKIAMTALDNWALETGRTYQCYEHFMVESGRGMGWHNFSGLSSPVVNWFSAYYSIGTVSTGFDVMICRPQMNEACTEYSAKLVFDKDAAGRTATMILCMDPSHHYEAKLDGKPLKVEEKRPGLLYVSVPERVKSAVIKVSSVN